MKKVAIFLVLTMCVTMVLSAHGGRRGGWGAGAPPSQEQFLADNSGVAAFIDSQKSEGSVILRVRPNWNSGQNNVEVVVIMDNQITIYQVNSQTGDVYNQTDAPDSVW